jgi:hypothetical protein
MESGELLGADEISLAASQAGRQAENPHDDRAFKENGSHRTTINMA